MTRTSTTTIIVLGALMAISPFSIDTYLASFPAIAHSLHTGVAQVGYTLTAYFAGVCVGQLFYGILIDRFGRKRPVILGLALYAVAALGCAVAPTLPALVTFRILMALGGCVGMVASRAIVRDLFPASAVAPVLSQLVLVMAVAPIVAPSIGSMVNAALGWRWIFGLLSVIGVAIALVVAAKLPESKQPDAAVSLKPRRLWMEYAAVLRERSFVLYALAGGIGYAGMFAYIAGSPFVFMEKLGLTATQYAWAFSFNALGLIAGSQLNRWALGRFNISLMLTWAARCLLVCALALTLVLATDANVWPTLGCTFLFLLCLGSINPNTQAAALQPFGNAAGRSSAILGTVQMSAAVLTSWLVSFLHNGTTLVMPLIMTACAVIALALLASAQQTHRPVTAH